ncbi:hypothetical protein EVAR_3310_1 [Eumeta japonica]|uniref:Uncharacterized protein n=1 Tax=Eumeta variegata TaxID=151549 RepID=A0A4C1SXU7_EUMVA|nr:hypothetical protein EVAR_3310_1 [Eumeta japonica]
MKVACAFEKFFVSIPVSTTQSLKSSSTLAESLLKRNVDDRLTVKAGVELIQQIFDAWEDLWDAIGDSFDLSEAFGCVHDDTLIRKLHYTSWVDPLDSGVSSK